jgi:hypothetical protein
VVGSSSSIRVRACAAWLACPVHAATAGNRDCASNRDGYIQRIDGIIFGDNPDQGVVRGDSFVDAGLRFAIDFPSGRDVVNGPSQVVAKEPGANGLMLVQHLEQGAGRTIQEVGLRSKESAGFRVSDDRRVTINRFRPMTRGEGEEIRPNRGGSVHRGQDDEWQPFAERHRKASREGHDACDHGWPRVNDRPRRGERLKIVVVG